MIKLVPLLEKQILGIAKTRPTVILPEGKDRRMIAAASRLSALANVVLVNARDAVVEQIEREQIELRGSLRRFLSSVRCVMPDEMPEVCAELARRYHEMSQGKRWAMSFDEARDLVRQPIHFACMAVRCGYADAVLGGVAHSSRDFFKPALRVLRTDNAAFEVGLFSLPDEHPEGLYKQNLIAFADVAINPQPDAKTLAQIAVGACKIVRDLVPEEVLPKINGAIVSYSTRGSGEGESVLRVRGAGELIPGMLEEAVRQNPAYASICIEPELQISCAISIAAAQSKLKEAAADPDSAVGRANVLIVPNLDTGNLLYHLYATRFPNADKLLMVGGVNSQVLDYSRGATVDDIVLGGLGTVLRLKKRADWSQTPKSDFFPRYRVLVVNPGSTSTKLKAFEGTQVLFEREVEHPTAELAACPKIFDQLELRLGVVRKAIAEEGFELASAHALVGRGGLIRPVVSGTYRVNEKMLADLLAAQRGEHASNLGAAIVHALAQEHGQPAYIVDPVVVDELDPLSRIIGVEGYERTAIWHALSQKAVAKTYAEAQMADYSELNLIVAHMGGGVTVGAHQKGRCVFVNDGLHEGPMTPERAGSVPTSVVMDLCFGKQLDKAGVKKALIGKGGLVALLGTSSLREVEARILAGDEKVSTVFEAMARSIAGQIASTTVHFNGEQVDRVILTGGMARCTLLTDRIQALCGPLKLAFTLYPGEMEAEALRDGAVRVLRGQEPVLEY
ncbi:MAG: butyrate kinase [Myxococcota bacterium]|jgi:butyrate kinase|nr:butyrate kinase [Myxococcota bacterium]